MAPWKSGTVLARVAVLIALIGLTFVLVLVGIVSARSGPGIWSALAFIGVSVWVTVAIHERSSRGAS